jgi:heat shock transcription factor, other eukaryote
LQGFRKVDPDRWEFANECFLGGQRHFLKLIKRRQPPSYLAASQHQQGLGTYLEVGHLGLDEEIDLLKRDKNVLLAEVVKLRQEQQSTKAGMRAMEERLQRAEGRQVQMMGLLARAMQNPDFFQQLLAQHQDMRRELEDAFSKKRRRPIDIVPFAAGGAAGTEHATASRCQTTTLHQGEVLDSALFFFGRIGREFEDLSEPACSELENLALNIQGFRKRKQDEQAGGETAELTDDFWEELLSEGMRSEGEMTDEMETRRPLGRHVDALAQKLSFLSNSTTK